MNNPLLWLELRIRIRERKLWIVTCLYLFCLFVISAISISSAAREGTESNPATTGMSIFGFGVFSLAGLLVILGPLASAGAISQEREQRTLPALLNTPMSPSTIVAGKLLAAWAFVLWLALLSLPFLALSVVWGAVDVARMASGMGLAIAAGFVTSAIAIGLSGYFRRSLTSYLATGAMMFLWLVVWPIFGFLVMSFTHTNGDLEKHPWIVYAFLYHHPLAPLIYLMTSTLDDSANPPPAAIIPFALSVWTVLAGLFFSVACRGLRRSGARSPS